MSEPQNRNTSKTLLLRLRDLDDQLAWEEFVERYGPEILRWCLENRLQESDARDVAQEVLGKLVAVMRDFEYQPNRGSFRGWLKTVTKNAVRDVGRKWERRITGSGKTVVNTFLHNLVGDENLAALESTIEARHEQQLLAEAEQRVQTRVKPKTWQAFQLTAVDGVSAKEAAEKLGMPISEVYVSKSRVTKHLREEVKQLNEDPTDSV